MMSKLKECSLYIDGMHCASCEVLIEKKLLKKKEISGADASLKDGRVNIAYKGEKPDIRAINNQFKDLGYKFSYEKSKTENKPLLKVNEKGQFIVNPKKLTQGLKTLLIFSVLLVAFLVLMNMEFARFASVDSNSTIVAFVVLGFIAGISSCAALVGGVLLSMVKQWNELYIDSGSDREKAKPHIMFHIGRLVSFAILGGVLGAVGKGITLDNPTVYAVMILIVSVIMFVLALQMLDVSWAQRFRIAAPKFLIRGVADESKYSGRYMPFIIGAITFFLPCGFTLIAQGVALTSGSFVRGSLIMSAFAIGTFPLLALISMSGIKLSSKPHLTARFNHVAGLLILLFVLFNINSQLNVLGYPSFSDIKLSSSTSVTNDTLAETVDGKQVINMVATGFSYNATGSTTLKAGVPAVIEIDNQGIQGCGTYLAARGLIDGFVLLKNGVNTIDIGSPKAGTYKVTCSMGMVPPVTVKVI